MVINKNKQVIRIVNYKHPTLGKIANSKHPTQQIGKIADRKNLTI